MTSDPNKGLIRDEAIRVVTSTLSDGRELLYFDDAGTTRSPERRADQRPQADRTGTATARLDPLTGEWVSVATARQHRVNLPPAHLDPLAPQSPTNDSEIPDDYDVAVFENRSPSFGPDLVTALPDIPSSGASGEHHAPAGGRCEVVCFDPASTGSFAGLGSHRARTVIEAWAHRTHALEQLSGVRQVFAFENRGEAIGVTLHHPHGQIYAYPFITPRTRLTVERTRTTPRLFHEILEREALGPRVLYAGEHWTAFVPYSARWPLEIHALPHRHIGSLAQTSLAERAELATLLPPLLGSLDVLYNSTTPYMLGWHQAPVGVDEIRLMLTVYSPRRAADKLKFMAGSESIMGAWISDVSPEDTAARLAESFAQAREEYA